MCNATGARCVCVCVCDSWLKPFFASPSLLVPSNCAWINKSLKLCVCITTQHTQFNTCFLCSSNKKKRGKRSSNVFHLVFRCFLVFRTCFQPVRAFFLSFFLGKKFFCSFPGTICYTGNVWQRVLDWFCVFDVHFFLSRERGGGGGGGEEKDYSVTSMFYN